MNALQSTLIAAIAGALAAAPLVGGADRAQAQDYWDERREMIYELRQQQRQAWEQRRELEDFQDELEMLHEEIEELWEETEARLQDLDQDGAQYDNNPRHRRSRAYHRAPFYDGRYWSPRRTARYYDPYWGWRGPRYGRPYTRYYGTPRIGYFRDPWGRGVRIGGFRAGF